VSWASTRYAGHVLILCAIVFIPDGRNSRITEGLTLYDAIKEIPGKN
jgi:hypothetical protein